MFGELMRQFDYNGSNVRFSTLRDEPAVVASDACRELGLANTSKAVSRLDEDEKGITTVHTPGGDQRLLVISHTGFIRLAMTSRLPEAKPFQRWVAERIKEIMRDGLSIDPAYADHPAVLAASSAFEAVKVAVRAEKAAQAALERVDRLELNIGELNDGYITVMGWFKLHQGTVIEQDAARIGKEASRICREREIATGSVRHAKYGRVKTYPESIVAEAYQWFRGSGRLFG